MGCVTEVKRTERGWGGHFICANYCRFRRNTLLQYGDRRIVVSTVGNYHTQDGKLETIGAFGRYYETMAFEAQKEGAYWETNVSQQISFDSEWALCFDEAQKIPEDIDLRADAMHDAVVRKLTEKIVIPISAE
jgi:hypothetical protein